MSNTESNTANNTQKRNALNWFEIPVSDMQRAQKFYGFVFDVELKSEDFNGIEMSILPFNDGVGGSLMKSAERGYKPSMEGSIVYLNGGEDLAKPLAKVTEAGGQAIMPKTQIGPDGFIALFIDSEGNKVGLHSYS